MEVEVEMVVLVEVEMEVEMEVEVEVAIEVVVVMVQPPRAWAGRQLRGCQKQTMWQQRAHDRNTPRLQGPTCCTEHLLPPLQTSATTRRCRRTES
ncbi:hypothetical protein E2C01_068201 [Portunus trituberculatus]|uniref:Uncharacterized protein n=1 Tax=Portunus trituberculatus TaxID=210409 RepID=A0A5B7HLU2_PORTR|nr:hypothetical protein [Portunus trituberculatus]